MFHKASEINIEDYLQSKYNNSKSNIYEILKSTKKLVKNSKKYNFYINQYNDKTQIRSFKLPEVNAYPIFKNQELISISKNNYDVSSEQNFYNNKINEIQSPNTTTKTNTKPYNSKNNSHSNFEFLKTKKIATQFNSAQMTNKHKKFISTSKTELNNSAIGKSLRLKTLLVSERNQLENSKTKDLKNSINELDFFIDLNSPVNISYDPDKIYNKVDFYMDLIRSKVSYFKTNKNENFTTNLTRKYKQTSLNEIDISLKSIQIEFRNATNKMIIPFSFYLPFSLIPIFYYNDIEIFKRVLISIVKFNDNYDGIELAEDEIYQILNKMKEFSTNEDSSIKTDTKTEFQSENEYENQEVEKRKIEKEKEKDYLDKVRKSYFRKSRMNTYKFDWITPKYVYVVELRLPEIEINTIQESKRIRKFIDTELLFYMYSLNFVNWDFYVVNYLVYIKDFRNFLNKTFSKIPNFVHKQTKISINEEPFIENYFTKEYRTKRNLSGENCYSYIITWKENEINKNYLHKITGLNIITRDDFFNENHFTFNLKQTMMLNQIGDENELNSFLIKMLIIDEKKEKISVDYGSFENFDDRNFQIITDVFSGKNRHGVKLEIIYPKLEIFSIENGLLLKKENESGDVSISKNFLNLISNTDSDEMGLLIFKYKPWNTSLLNFKPSSKNLIVNTSQNRRRSFAQTDKFGTKQQFSKTPKVIIEDGKKKDPLYERSARVIEEHKKKEYYERSPRIVEEHKKKDPFNERTPRIIDESRKKDYNLNFTDMKTLNIKALHNNY